MLKSTVFGINLAKNIIQVCEINKHGDLVNHNAISRLSLASLF